MTTRSLILIGIVSFIGFLIASAPAAAVWPRVAPKLPTLQLSGLSGTVLHGTAAAVTVGGRLVARPLAWQFSPLSLLGARLGFEIDGTLDGLRYAGHVARTLSGGTRIADLQASGSLRGLLALSGDVGLPLDGDASFDFEALDLVDGFPMRAIGTLQVAGVRLSLGPQPQPLGDLKLDIRTEADVIIAQVTPLSGPLDIGGELRLFADRNYEVDLKVKAKPDAPAQVANLLRTLGQPDTDGYFRIKQRAAI